MSTDLTVLIQTFNRPDKVTSLIRSLTFEDLTGIEILVIDNGSTTDNQALENELGNLPNARLIRREMNCLCVDCCQSTINLVNSDYILNPGDDDIIVPKSLQKLRNEIAESKDFDVFITSMEIIDEFGEKSGSNFFPSDAEIRMPHLMLAHLLRDNFIAWPSTVFRKEMFTKLSESGFRYRTTLDWAFWIINSPTMNVKTTFLEVVKYVRHKNNESAVVSETQQRQESISMRLRALSSPEIKSALSRYSAGEAEELILAINSAGGLSNSLETNQLLTTALVQCFSLENQGSWESYLLGLNMIPWDQNSFRITHHIEGDIEKYWLAYPFTLVFDSESCFVSLEEKYTPQLKHDPKNKKTTLIVSCKCSNLEADNRIIVDCSDSFSVKDDQQLYNILATVHSNHHEILYRKFEGFESVMINCYRFIKKRISPRILSKFRRVLNN